MTTLGSLRVGGTPDERAVSFRVIRATLLGAVVAFGEALPDDAPVTLDALRGVVDASAAELAAQYRAMLPWVREDRLN